MSKKDKSNRIKIGILKLGNIASSVLLEMLLDERADRLDIDIRTISSGAKLEKEAINDAFTISKTIDKDLLIIATPNASLTNPMEVIIEAGAANTPVIVLTDILKKESIEVLKEKGIGYFVVKPDAMIGARREFLDPVEMALFNSDLLKVLAIGGVFSILYQEIDKVISLIKKNEKIVLPQLIITPTLAVKSAGFANPYAEAKAKAALIIAQRVAAINTEGCFKIKNRL
ncbi:MAG: F420-dependent methylenetetrahydromethanopterin dehydrogenase, partial [Candidatus Heimdallarchaeota archaeon]